MKAGFSSLPSYVLASSATEHQVKLWNLDKPSIGDPIVSLATNNNNNTGHSKPINDIAFLPEQRLATASDDHTVRLWDLGDAQCLHTLTGHTAPVNTLQTIAASDDQDEQITHLVSGSDDSTIRIWSLLDGRCERTITAHSAPVTALLAWTRADGRRTLISASNDRTVKVWSLEEDDEFEEKNGPLRTMIGHTEHVTALELVDAAHVASASADTSVKIWSLRSGACVATLSAHTGPVTSLCMLDERVLASASLDKSIRVWRLSFDAGPSALEYEVSSLHNQNHKMKGTFVALQF